jgi:tyrosinase
MRTTGNRLHRRTFLASAATATGLAAAGITPARAAKYTRYNVTSTEGRQMLASYAKGVAAMLQLPPDHPHNWFRNAFTHFMDCPHGNWWFYVWHRGYVGYFEQTIRKLSGDANFAMPFWDWSELPQIPDEMFNGVLTPTDKAFAPFTTDLATFTKFIQPSMLAYWNSLSKDQLAQEADRGVTSFEELWAGVTGGGDPGNMAFATTDRARYLTRQNPKLDDATAYDCSRDVVLGGLAPSFFYASQLPPKYQQALSFNSVKSMSHTMQPDKLTWFSILEGLPHNNVHNYIGGVGPWDPGPYGNMTNFLSPVDPVFYLHHANMDRLWDVWSRKQLALHLSDRPQQADETVFMTEPFRFFVDSEGHFITNAKAGDYFSTDRFEYGYAKGTGEEVVPTTGAVAAAAPRLLAAAGAVQGNTGRVTLPRLAAQARLVAAVTLPRPAAGGGRSFDVLVNAPPGVTRVAANSPFFAGRVAFFGPTMANMQGPVTFLVPLPGTQSGARVKALATANANTTLNVTVVPARGSGPAPAIEGVAVQVL